MSGAKHLVYGLVDPRSLLIRYVGKSCSGLERPRRHHTDPEVYPRLHISRWIRELQGIGLNFEIVVLEECARDALANAERWWIAYGRTCGWPLTNLTDGGEGALGRQVSERTMERMCGERNPMKDPAARAKSSARQRGKHVSQETRAKLSRANSKPEVRAAIVARMVGDRNPARRPEVAARILAVKRTTEYRRRVSEKLRGHAVSEETRQKISRSLLARSHP